jgi:hypothetical protein
VQFQPPRSRHLSLSILATISLFGCSGQEAAQPPNVATPTTVHDPDDVPITEADVKMPVNFADAIPRIKIYREVIRSAVEAGTPAKAHRSLDELDIVLNKLPVLARDSGIPKEAWETINTTAREMRNLFNQVHSAIDEGRTPDYVAIAAPVDKAIERLESVSPATK